MTSFAFSISPEVSKITPYKPQLAASFVVDECNEIFDFNAPPFLLSTTTLIKQKFHIYIYIFEKVTTTMKAVAILVASLAVVTAFVPQQNAGLSSTKLEALADQVRTPHNVGVT